MVLLQPVKLASSGLGAGLLTRLIRSLLSLSDVSQQTPELLTALAQSVPDAFSGLAEPTPQLLDCYSQLFSLCMASGLGVQDSTGTTVGRGPRGLGSNSISSVLGPSVMKRLQQHLSSEFVQPGSERLDGAVSISLQDLAMLLQLLEKYEIPVSKGFVAACMSVCRNSIQPAGVNPR